MVCEVVVSGLGRHVMYSKVGRQSACPSHATHDSQHMQFDYDKPIVFRIGIPIRKVENPIIAVVGSLVSGANNNQQESLLRSGLEYKTFKGGE